MNQTEAPNLKEKASLKLNKVDQSLGLAVVSINYVIEFSQFWKKVRAVVIAIDPVNTYSASCSTDDAQTPSEKCPTYRLQRCGFRPVSNFYLRDSSCAVCIKIYII